MNDEISSNNLVYDTNNVDIEGQGGVSLQAYYDYDYRGYLQTIIGNQEKQQENVKNLHNLVNEGFTFLSFIIIIFLVYTLVKNFIRK